MSDRETLPGWCGLLSLRGDGHPFVVDADGQRTLQFDGLTIQSQMALDDPDALALDYTRTMMGFLLFHPAPRHVAMIGLGGGSLLKYCFKTMPETRVTAVEINPEVIALRDAFGIPPDGPRLRVVCRDGAEYMRDPGEAPDVLIVDGFDAGGMPEQLGSAGFYDHCCGMLAEGGMMVVNLWAGDRRYGLYASRIRDSFEGRIVAVRADEDSNRIVFASKDRRFPPGRAQLLDRARALALDHPFGLVPLAQRIRHRLDHRREDRDDPWPSGKRRR
ncbi:transferase [Aromatoleum anaerobium]|uniref:Transferase n=1 Tax=Aromatoleum anaerobium TaxID=182180 RepID=A0ABX1PFB7_9RHOO|nr:transferase [Aromatoleum anaerobium]MCK0509274.1 transferase [Aromatoleum anaerobium]